MTAVEILVRKDKTLSEDQKEYVLNFKYFAKTCIEWDHEIHRGADLSLICIAVAKCFALDDAEISNLPNEIPELNQNKDDKD